MFYSPSQPRSGGAFVCYYAQMDEKDIWRAAKILIDQHGDDAGTHAAMRADAMLEQDDMEGQAMWKRIVRAIEDLTSSDPGETLH